MDVLQFVRIDPWFEGFFILCFFLVGYCDCSYEYPFWEYNDVFVVMRSLIIVQSSGQCVSSTVGFSQNVTYLEVKLH